MFKIWNIWKKVSDRLIFQLIKNKYVFNSLPGGIKTLFFKDKTFFVMKNSIKNIIHQFKMEIILKKTCVMKNLIKNKPSS